MPKYVFSTSRWYRLGKWFGWMVSLPFIGLSGLILMIIGLLLLETIPEVALILFIIGGGVAFGISQTKV